MVLMGLQIVKGLMPLLHILMFCADRQTDKQTRGRLGTNEYLRKRTQRIIMAEI